MIAHDRLERTAKRNMLVVDDVPPIGDAWVGLAQRVKGIDIRASIETSGKRAIDLLQQRPFDLVVSDFRLLDADGLHVLSAARRLVPNAYRILMTSYADVPAPMSRIRDANVHAYVLKPFDTQEMLLLLRDFLGGTESAISDWEAHAREVERQSA